MTLHVERVGPAALIQDLGRAGLADIGVTGSGVADRAAAALALRCVGGDRRDALIEVLMGGLALRTDRPAVVALTGARTPYVVTGAAGRRHGGSGDVVFLAAGERLELGAPTHGVRTYLAVRGGVQVPPVLGSRSFDSMAGLGPAPLRAGDALTVGDGCAAEEAPETPAAPAAWAPGWCCLTGSGVTGAAGGAGEVDGTPLALEVLPGPREDLFDPEAWQVLARPSVVEAECDRIGVRLRPASPVRRRDLRELPSEGMVRGAVQVPPDGRPVLFGPDHPVTGGYPVIGVLTEAAADLAAQLRPGERVRLARVDRW